MAAHEALAGRDEPAGVLGVVGVVLEAHDRRDRHDVALHALDLGDLGHAAHAVGALGVDDEVDGLADVLKDLTRGHAGVGLLDERAKAHGHLAAVVRMDSGERAVVAGGHGLEHVEGRRVAALADDDPVGALAQRVGHEVAVVDAALALHVGVARLHAGDVRLVQAQLGRVLDGDDALLGRDVERDCVEQRRLARSGAAGHDGGHAALHDGAHDLEHAAVERPVGHQGLGGERVLAELADVDEVVVDRDALEHRVDARAVEGRAGADDGAVAQRRGLVAAAVHARGDAVDGELHVVVVLEVHVGEHEPAGALDPHRVGPVDHDLGKRFVVQQVLERTEVVQVVDGRAQHLLVGVVGDAAGLVDEALGHEVVERRVVDDGADDRGRVAVASCRVAVGLLGLVVG